MSDENSFLLINLKEDSSKDIAKVISNDTCRTILDFLANNSDSTETEISEKLKLPISTVHYNLKHLVKGKLVVADEYHYSKKGKEVSHYKLANKFIIIAPQETKENKGIFQKLKDIIPLSIFTVVAAGVLFIQNIADKIGFNMSKSMAMDAAPIAGGLVREVPEAMIIADYAAGEVAVESANTVMTKTAELSPQPEYFCGTPYVNEPNYILWFVTGAVSIIIFFGIYKIIKHYLNKRSKKKKN